MGKLIIFLKWISKNALREVLPNGLHVSSNDHASKSDICSRETENQNRFL
jgi:hypothetical protein